MLKKRIWTAIIGVSLIIGVLLWGPTPWRILVTVATLIAVSEYTAMFGLAWRSLSTLWCYFIVLLIQWYPHWYAPIWLECIVGSALLIPVVSKNKNTIKEASAVLVGALYIGYGGNSLAQLRAIPHGFAWIMLCLISIWMTDTVAYFIGRTVKGPKLWPAISPRKTVSGAVGGVVGAVVGAVVFGYCAVPGFDPLSYAVIGAVISIAGQAGDFIESAYKRSTGVKDSGHILPGHGGILDRVDSLLFAAPFALYLISTGATTWFQ